MEGQVTFHLLVTEWKVASPLLVQHPLNYGKTNYISPTDDEV